MFEDSLFEYENKLVGKMTNYIKILILLELKTLFYPLMILSIPNSNKTKLLSNLTAFKQMPFKPG